MSETLKKGAARAVADVTAGMLLASVEIKASPERVFKAISSDQIANWWGSPDVYRVTKWAGDLKVGGQWRSDGVGSDGKAFSVRGEFLEIDPPRKLVHTWLYDWEPNTSTTITYRLEPIDGGTRLTVKHEGFGANAKSCVDHTEGWEWVMGWLNTWMENQ